MGFLQQVVLKLCVDIDLEDEHKNGTMGKNLGLR